jgi:hypothetical protein
MTSATPSASTNDFRVCVTKDWQGGQPASVIAKTSTFAGAAAAEETKAAINATFIAFESRANALV